MQHKISANKSKIKKKRKKGRKKNTMTEMLNSLEGIESIFEQEEECIRKL